MCDAIPIYYLQGKWGATFTRPTWHFNCSGQAGNSHCWAWSMHSFPNTEGNSSIYPKKNPLKPYVKANPSFYCSAVIWIQAYFEILAWLLVCDSDPCACPFPLKLSLRNRKSFFPGCLKFARVNRSLSAPHFSFHLVHAEEDGTRPLNSPLCLLHDVWWWLCCCQGERNMTKVKIFHKRWEVRENCELRRKPREGLIGFFPP